MKPPFSKYISAVYRVMLQFYPDKHIDAAHTTAPLDRYYSLGLSPSSAASAALKYYEHHCIVEEGAGELEDE